MMHAVRCTSPLFQHIDPSMYEEVLQCLHAYEKQYHTDETIANWKETLSSFGIVLSGKVHIIKLDFLGNTTIVAEISSGQLFGESFAFSQTPLQVQIQCAKDTTVLWIPVKDLLHVEGSTCVYHAQLIQNLLQILATKNQFLTQRIDHLSKRGIKEKLLSYLIQQAQQSNCSTFAIPFDRQELADYLCVDRSALSYVLSNLKKEGILSFQKNVFTLLLPIE